MNVFWLDDDLKRSARYHCDQHVNKMLLEAVQLLCTAARVNGFEVEWLYRKTHTDHPVTLWVVESKANWSLLRKHAQALNEEFRERFGHSEDHASWQVAEKLDPDQIDFPSQELTPRPQAMPDQYQIPGEPIQAYRDYYAGEKADMASYKYTKRPSWLP